MVGSTLTAMVLGLLSQGERHGYDLLRDMEERGMLRWTKASKVGVYKALARLEGEGCLTSWTEREGNLPQRRVYAITATGEARLQDLLYSLCSSREPLRMDAAVGVAFISRLEPGEACEALRQRREFLAGQAKRLARERKMLKGFADDTFLDILAREQSMYREELRWLDRIIARIENREVPARTSGSMRRSRP